MGGEEKMVVYLEGFGVEEVKWKQYKLQNFSKNWVCVLCVFACLMYACNNIDVPHPHQLGKMLIQTAQRFHSISVWMTNINEIHTHAQKKKSAFEGVGQEKPSLTHGTSIDCYNDLEITVEHFKKLKDLVCDIFSKLP